MANIILKEKIRNPQNDNWITPFYVTDDNNIHINGFLTTDEAVNTNNIKDNAITAKKILNGEIGTDELASDSVTNGKIKPGAVGRDTLATNSVSTDKIINSAVTTNKIADYAVNVNKIEDGAITENKINAGAIIPGHLKNPVTRVMAPFDPEGTGLYNGSFKLKFNY